MTNKASDKRTVLDFRRKVLRELKKIKIAWPDLNYTTAPGVLILHPSTPSIRGQGSGRVRLSVIEDLSAASLVGFLEQSVAPCSVVHTDGWGGYRPLANKGYDHRRETQGHAKNAVKLFPRVHRVFSNLKTWLAGTHHGVGEQHLQHYLNEYVFRFNRRRAPMAAFQSLLGLASQHQPTTYHMLYDGESTG